MKTPIDNGWWRPRLELVFNYIYPSGLATQISFPPSNLCRMYHFGLNIFSMHILSYNLGWMISGRRTVAESLSASLTEVGLGWVFQRLDFRDLIANRRAGDSYYLMDGL